MTEGYLSLEKMQAVSWIFLAILSIGALLLFSWQFAVSVVAGGVISILSFSFANRDVIRLVDSVVSESTMEDRKAVAQQGQKGYLTKFWLRIVIIGIVLFLLINSGGANVFGLIIGLSTVVLTVTYTACSVAGRYFFRGRR